MKKQIFSICCLALLVLLGACNKEGQSISSLTGEAALIAKINRVKGAQGSVTIRAHTTVSRYVGNSTSYEIGGSFPDQPFEQIMVGALRLEAWQKFRPDINTAQYICTDTTAIANEQAKQMFGTNVAVKYQRKDGSGSKTEYRIEVPQQLDLDVPLNPTPTGGSSSNRNVPLTWRRDANNSEVYILISFNPESVSNSSVRSSPPVDRFLTVPDNGSYTLNESQFAGIPTGAYFIIVVARGTTAVAAGGTTGYSAINALSTGTIKGQIGGGGGCSSCPYPL